MWSYVPLRQRIPAEHPLRPLGPWWTSRPGALAALDQLYSKVGRPSIPPEHLLRALLLQCSTACAASGCSWKAGLQPALPLVRRLAMDDPIWDATVFTRTENACSAGTLPARFLTGPRAGGTARPAADEHFTVDGTLIDAWASLKSFQRKDTPPRPRTIRATRR